MARGQGGNMPTIVVLRLQVAHSAGLGDAGKAGKRVEYGLLHAKEHGLL